MFLYRLHTQFSFCSKIKLFTNIHIHTIKLKDVPRPIVATWFFIFEFVKVYVVMPQINIILIPFTTNPTGISSLSCVNLLMLVQIILRDTSVATHRANVGLDPSMYSFVMHKGCSRPELFLTEPTSIHTSVCRHVLVQPNLDGKSLGADVTGIGTHVGMGCQVILESTLLWKAAMAHGANIRPFSAVIFFVRSQRTLICKRFSATRATIPFPAVKFQMHSRRFCRR